MKDAGTESNFNDSQFEQLHPFSLLPSLDHKSVGTNSKQEFNV